jgi:ABC-type multidrug transport system ATPase subunit
MQCFEYLKSISTETAILFVTNNIRQAEMLASRILVIDKGKTVYMSENVKEGARIYLELILPQQKENNNDALF